MSPQTMSSAVVQVFMADRHSSWNKRCCGVACLVKDNPQRSYFIRVFDIKVGVTPSCWSAAAARPVPSSPLTSSLQESKMAFEQELYNNFSIYLSRPFFMTFAGDVSLRFIVFKSRSRRLC